MGDAASRQPMTVGVLLFDRFELLDVCGPLEMLGVLPDWFDLRIVAREREPVASTQGPRLDVDLTLAEAERFDILFIPGGIGTRVEVENAELLDWIHTRAERADHVATVCTGSGLLAATGALDGHRATSNKRAFEWVRSMGPKVDWVAQARWVRDGKFITSGGVAAGIDMALGLIAELVGEGVAIEVAKGTEYDWHRDPGWDPFAAANGLV
jgi:transcriptional regulator GlxA family with amidase domain